MSNSYPWSRATWPLQFGLELQSVNDLCDHAYLERFDCGLPLRQLLLTLLLFFASRTANSNSFVPVLLCVLAPAAPRNCSVESILLPSIALCCRCGECG